MPLSPDEYGFNRSMVLHAKREQIALGIIICDAERNGVVNLQAISRPAHRAKWRKTKSFFPDAIPPRPATSYPLCPAKERMIAMR